MIELILNRIRSDYLQNTDSLVLKVKYEISQKLAVDAAILGDEETEDGKPTGALSGSVTISFSKAVVCFNLETTIEVPRMPDAACFLVQISLFVRSEIATRLNAKCFD